MKTFCFLSLVLFALAFSAVPTKSSDSMTDVTAYAYSSEWTEYIFDPSWPGDLWYKEMKDVKTLHDRSRRHDICLRIHAPPRPKKR